MDFDKLEKEVFEVAKFLDGGTSKIPQVDFINDYNRLKDQIISRENYSYINFHRLRQFVEANQHFSLAMEDKTAKLNWTGFSKKEQKAILDLSDQFDFFRDAAREITEFLMSHFHELNDYQDPISNIRYLKEIIYTENEDKNEEIGVEIAPVVWTGTPGEFGAIIKVLIEKGYIEKIRDLKNTVKLLNKLFVIRNEHGEIVSDSYLYRCFGEKMRTYYRDELKIPCSDNYSKSK
jgi:hypothetical protein